MLNPQSRYIAIYKDRAEARIRYFGTFVSIRAVEDFLDGLPEPLEGGFKTFKTLQPYSSQDTSLVSDVIVRERKHGHILDTTHSLAASP